MLAAGGDLGRERYQAATAHLREREPAYEAYDEGRAALADDRPADAERSAQQALRLLPGEANIHALLGDIDLQRAALRRCGSPLRRMRSRATTISSTTTCKRGSPTGSCATGKTSRAELETSVAAAADGRGHLRARHAWPSSAAIAKRRSSTTRKPRARKARPAQAAEEAAVRLDLPNNPGKYIQARGGLDNSGQLIVEVANPTRVAVTDVLVAVRFVDSQGAVRELDRRINRAAAGAGHALRDGARAVHVGAAVRGRRDGRARRAQRLASSISISCCASRSRLNV